MPSKPRNERKGTRQNNDDKAETNGKVHVSNINNQASKAQKSEPKRAQDLSLFEALVECATREESSGTVSDDDTGPIHDIFKFRISVHNLNDFWTDYICPNRQGKTGAGIPIISTRSLRAMMTLAQSPAHLVEGVRA